MFLMHSLPTFEVHLRTAKKSEATIDSYLKACRQFTHWIQSDRNGPVMIADVKEQDIQRYLDWLDTEKDYKPASINVALNGIRNLFKYALRMELIEKDPTQYLGNVKNHTLRRDYLTAEEMQTLLETIDHEIGNIVVRTLALTGLRIGECLALTFEDIDFTTNKIHVRHGKGNKPRTLPLSDDLKPYLLRYKNGPRKFVKGSELFFATAKTGTISAQYINRLLKEAVKELKWKKNVTCHVLRHTFASKLVKNGTGIPTVAALLGHSDYRTVTSVYVHIDEGDLQSAVNGLNL